MVNYTSSSRKISRQGFKIHITGAKNKDDGSVIINIVFS